MSFALDAPQRKQLERRRQNTRDSRLAMRLSSVLWHDDGMTQNEIAHLLGVCQRTVRNWLRLYRKNGLEALCTLHYKGDSGELTSAQAKQLQAEIQTGRFRCARQVREWIRVTFQVSYSLSGTKRLLQRLGCSFHKTTGFLFKAKRDKQEEFVRKYEIDRPAEGAATRRYFVDACHPIWGLELGYSCWLLRGQRFLVGMGGGRKRLNILGAYSPQDHEYLDLRVPKGTISAAQVIELMTRLQRRHPKTKKFILYLDADRQRIVDLEGSFACHRITPVNVGRNRHSGRGLVSVPACSPPRDHRGGVATEPGGRAAQDVVSRGFLGFPT